MGRRLNHTERQRAANRDASGDVPIVTTDPSSDATADELRVFDAMDRTKMARARQQGGRGERRERDARKAEAGHRQKAAAVRWNKG